MSALLRKGKIRIRVRNPRRVHIKFGYIMVSMGTVFEPCSKNCSFPNFMIIVEGTMTPLPGDSWLNQEWFPEPRYPYCCNSFPGLSWWVYKQHMTQAKQISVFSQNFWPGIGKLFQFLKNLQFIFYSETIKIHTQKWQ